MNTKLYQAIACKLSAIANCIESGITDWQERHLDGLNALIKEYMPSGSGFDAGTRLDFNDSTPDRLIFTTSFHHMDENGMYCGWSEHTVAVTASLCFGFEIDMESDYEGVDRHYRNEDTGEQLQDTDFSSDSDYIAEEFHHALSQTIGA